MVHLTYAIGQFFAIMLGAIARAIGSVLAVIVLLALAALLMLLVIRWFRRMRK